MVHKDFMDNLMTDTIPDSEAAMDNVRKDLDDLKKWVHYTIVMRQALYHADRMVEEMRKHDNLTVMRPRAEELAMHIGMCLDDHLEDMNILIDRLRANLYGDNR